MQSAGSTRSGTTAARRSSPRWSPRSRARHRRAIPATPARPRRTGLRPEPPSQCERAPEDLAHDLVAAAAERPQAGVARGAPDPDLADVAGAAVALQAG